MTDTVDVGVDCGREKVGLRKEEKMGKKWRKKGKKKGGMLFAFRTQVAPLKLMGKRGFEPTTCRELRSGRAD